MRKGFTLIELLAVIALIGVLITISIPAYNNIKKKSAERTLENKISMLEVAAYNYGNANINDVKNTPEDFFNLTIAELIEAGYLSSESDDGNFLINPVTGLSMSDTVTVTYEDYRIKVLVNGGELGLSLVVLANGGTWDGTSPISILSGGTITVNNPTKNNYTFAGWTVEGEGSGFAGTTFTMGSESTVITANWTLAYYNLIVNANGGEWGGTTPISVQSGATTLINTLPIKNGYAFTGWTVSGAGSTMNGTTFTMGTANASLTANWLTYSSMFTYIVGGNPGVSGTDYIVIDDTNYNWRIKFLTSGIFTPLANLNIDIFLVGGGSSGGGSSNGGGGGSGGYTNTVSSVSLTANTAYTVTVGAGGNYAGDIRHDGFASYFGAYTAAGGLCATHHSTTGGNGGSGGGRGGIDSTNTTGQAGAAYGNTAATGTGTGQGTTTCEFGQGTLSACNAGVTLYAGGGGGRNRLGGAGGGGNGYGQGDMHGDTNTGGGGGGGVNANVGVGGSGIVIIRNHR